LIIKIEKLDDVYVRVFGDASIEAELADFFTYEYPGARFTPQYKARLWDGKVRLYDQLRKTLYVGLVHYVIEFAKRNGYDYELSDDLKLQGGISKDYIEGFVQSLNPSSRGQPISVRDYQLDAVFHAIGRERILLLSPTASGKSLIIYSILRYHLEYGRKIILIVPTTSLVEQMYADFEDYSSANGFNVEQHCQKLYSGFPKDFTRDVLITTWQSVYKQPRNWFRQFNVMFGDEAHTFKAKSLTDTMGKMDTIPYRIGTTGTLDNKKVHRLTLEGIFGPVYKVTTTKQLMDTGRLSDLDITCLLLQYPEEIRKERKNSTYQDEMDFIVQNEKRNKFIRNLACKQKGNTLVLFQFVKKHGIPLYESILEKAGTKQVFFVSGDTVVSERERIREIARDIDDCIIVASYGTFSTGINIPSIENIIFASPSKSKIRNLQSIGRGLRLKEGKTKANLYDIADDLHWKSKKNHTLNHAAERYKTYTEEEFKLKLVEVDLYGQQ
jgi:superfamily II DNA or RNA helicase